ncbi:MAG: UPF0175 family protein [Nostoc sp.]|uniref:UPF0175 family protein n=1 Tax=Nostoc sp. TaxID=1180 RepID=UPI002FFBF632
MQRRRGAESAFASLFYVESQTLFLVMSQFVSSINLQLSLDSISQGEQASRQEIALQLYDQNIFTFGQARRLANLSVWEFQQLLGQQKIPRHYTEIDLADDIESIKIGSW